MKKCWEGLLRGQQFKRRLRNTALNETEVLSSKEGAWIPNSKNSTYLLWWSLGNWSQQQTGGQGVPSVTGWRAGWGLVPRKLSLVFSLPGPGVLGLKGCLIWSVRRYPDPAILCCCWCRWRMRWRSSPGSSGRRAWSRRWRSTLRKSSFSWVLVPELGGWRGWGVPGLRPWMVPQVLLCLCPCPAPWIFTYLLFLLVLSHVQLFCNPIDCSPPGSSVHGISQNAGVGCHFLRRGSFRSRDWTWVSSFGRQILNHWATRETPPSLILNI